MQISVSGLSMRLCLPLSLKPCICYRATIRAKVMGRRSIPRQRTVCMMTCHTQASVRFPSIAGKPRRCRHVGVRSLELQNQWAVHQQSAHPPSCETLLDCKCNRHNITEQGIDQDISRHSHCLCQHALPTAFCIDVSPIGLAGRPRHVRAGERNNQNSRTAATQHNSFGASSPCKRHMQRNDDRRLLDEDVQKSMFGLKLLDLSLP